MSYWVKWYEHDKYSYSDPLTIDVSCSCSISVPALNINKMFSADVYHSEGTSSYISKKQKKAKRKATADALKKKKNKVKKDITEYLKNMFK